MISEKKDLSNLLILRVESLYGRELRVSGNEISKVYYGVLQVRDFVLLKQDVLELSSDYRYGNFGFLDFCNLMRDNFNHYVWVSWGDFERKQIERLCKRKKIAYPLSSTHLNLKALCSLKLKLSSELSLEDAQKRLSLQSTSNPISKLVQISEYILQ